MTLSSSTWPIIMRHSQYPCNWPIFSLMGVITGFRRALFGTSAWPRLGHTPLRRLYSTQNNPGNNTDDTTSKAEDVTEGEAVDPEDAFKRAAEIVGKAITRPSIPKFFPELASLAITRRPVFPGFYKTVSLKDGQLVESLKERLANGKVYLGLFLRRDSSLPGMVDLNAPNVFKKIEEVHDIGVVSQLINIIPSGKDDAVAVLYPHRRIRLNRLVSTPSSDSTVTIESEETTGEFDSLPIVQAETIIDNQVDAKGQVFKAISQEIFVVLSDVAKLNPFFREHITHHNVSSAVFDDPHKLSDFIAVLCSGEPEELQSILADTDVESRMRRALTLLKKELQTAQLQHTISKDIEQKIGQKQKEFFLHEQLKAIKRELGMESDAKEKLLGNYREARSKLDMPESAAAVFEEEMNRLSTLETASSEFSMCRNYLDWLTQLPWNKTTTDQLDVERAKSVLDKSHAGMDDVKDRIVEFVAVSKLKGSAVQGKILCFVGPPGVGKTSIGKAIAEALGRQFYRFSVGGLSDVAEIKGHRRTYVGAMPGKLLQAMKRVQSSNPVILIDEVDKIGRGGIHGDPTSALLEVLDPEQNFSFSDHYLDTSYDLSKVLFICTANVLETIPAPLLDRMEVITLSGYTSEEKLDIAERFLIPKLLSENGLSNESVKIEKDTVNALLKGYCREAGVRSLKNALDRLLRKVAVERVKEQDQKAVSITPDRLSGLIGPELFKNERIHTEPILSPGLSTGLAWTAAGGSILYIETAAEDVYEKANGAGFKFTGQLGKVMEESCQIAFSYSKLYLRLHYPKNLFFNSHSCHLHVPEGAVPKDGPSAGCAMAVSLLSTALNRGISSTMAMTGELTLTGKVLPVGGIREKVAAAKRSGVDTVILPKSNQADWEKLPTYIKDGMTVHLVDTFEEIAEICGFHNAA